MKREDLVNTLKLTVQNMTLEEFAHLFVNEISAVEEFFKLYTNNPTNNKIIKN